MHIHSVSFLIGLAVASVCENALAAKPDAEQGEVTAITNSNSLLIPFIAECGEAKLASDIYDATVEMYVANDRIAPLLGKNIRLFDGKIEVNKTFIDHAPDAESCSNWIKSGNRALAETEALTIKYANR